MNQNYICQKRLHSTSLRKIFRKDFLKQFNRLNAAKLSVWTSKKCALQKNNLKKINLYRQFSEKNGIKPLKVNQKFEAKDSESNEVDLDVSFREKDKFTKTVSIWGASGIAGYLGSYILGSVSYGIAALPILVLHFEKLKDYVSIGTKNLIIVQRYIRARLEDEKFAAKDMNLTDCFDLIAEKRSNDIMMHFENTKWTYKQAEILTNKITNYFLSRNYEKGDVVALVITNRPEYLTLVLGLARIGVVVALIDTTLKNDAMLNAIYLSDCKGIIVSEDIIKDIYKLPEQINGKIEMFQLGGKKMYGNFKNLSNAIMDAPLQTPEIIHKVSQHDPLLYIYTNTGTNLLKFTQLPHSKFISQSVGITHLLNLKMDDVLYNPLPLSNSLGIVVGAGPTMICGIRSVICRKFSPANYWSDCIKYRCTAGQYVDDICQYLLSEPPHPHEKEHLIRKIIGNKVNPQTWEKFLKRFNADENEKEIDNNIINIGEEEPSRGLLSSILSQYVHSASRTKSRSSLVESIDETQSRYIAIKTLKIPLTPEPEIKHSVKTLIKNETEHSISNLNYYKNFQPRLKLNIPVERREILTLQKTDIKDKLINLHTLGRTENAYMWKGKTIITKEVESIIKIILGVSHCLVYGVSVPGIDGKIGMVALVDLENNMDIRMFSKQIQKYIPYYACPVIMRLVKECNDLDSFSKRKLSYTIEGFDPTNLQDKIFYLNKATGYFERLRGETYQKIIRNKILF